MKNKAKILAVIPTDHEITVNISIKSLYKKLLICEKKVAYLCIICENWDLLDQSVIKEISPEYSLKGLMLKLKLQYFGHLMRRTDTLEKTLMLGKTEGGRRRG